MLEVGLAGGVGLAQSAPELTMKYDQHSLHIDADNADLKQVLGKLASITDITIEVPAELERTITLNRSGISIEDALAAMLVGINHIIFYAGPSPGQAKITKVSILGKATPRRVTPRQRQLTRRIASYRKQLSTLQQRLAATNANGIRGRRYRQRIGRLEQIIARLESQR